MYKNISLADNILIYLRKPLDFLGTYKVLFTVSNWYDVFFFWLGIKKRVVLKPKRGSSKEIRSKEQFVEFFNTNTLITEGAYDELQIRIGSNDVSFSFDGKRIRLHADSELQKGNVIRLIRENFYEEQYGMLDVKGKTVLDIGANIGDTAIYFALKGAKRVYALEPFPRSYDLLVKNIRANGLEGSIVAINEGCGGKSAYMNVSESYESHGSSRLQGFRTGKRVRISRLSEILKRLGINDAVLKLDCEGCEYGIILGSDEEALHSFSEMAIEAHHGYLDLVGKLEESGFDVSKTVPKLPINVRTGKDVMLLNMLHAQRAIL